MATSIKTIRLTGFMTRRWREEIDGKKFRSQVRRRAEELAEDGSSVEIVDSTGERVDYFCGTEEHRSMMG